MIIKDFGKGKLIKFGAAHQAELKLITILLYFIALTVVTLAVETFITSFTPGLYLNALLPYFTCESTGQDANSDCQIFLSNVRRTDVFHLSVAFMFLVGVLPAVIFVFTADFKLVIKRYKEVREKIRQYRSTSIQ